MENKLVYDIHDRPKFGAMLIFALQQVLAILAATIAVPAIIGLPTQMPAAIFGAGVGTLVYQLFTRFKSPVFLGSSFAFLGSLGVAVAYGYCGIILGSIVAGLVYVVLALLIRLIGTGWVDKLMPPAIIGPTVALIGLSLAGNAMGDMVKANASANYGAYNWVGVWLLSLSSSSAPRKNAIKWPAWYPLFWVSSQAMQLPPSSPLSVWLPATTT